MNRRNFLSKVAIGAVAVVVAPKVLISKDPITIGTKEILAMRSKMAEDIANMPISQWGGFASEYEYQVMLQLQESMERAYLFGERRDSNRQFYSGKGWTSLL